jgi:succinoglycan biosynthesis protein ExoM
MRPLLVVAMATFRRPDCLERILPALVAQIDAYGDRASVLVVDNDPAGGAEDAVARWTSRRVRYVHEPRPGIAAARNRALEDAGAAELLVFIDDDEVPLDGWLQSLVDSWLEWRCVAVAGPVVARFEGGTVDQWAASSGVFDRARRATGTVLQGAATNNLLLDLTQLRSYGLGFDESFGLTGGSDTMLTHSLIKRGATIRWCDEAEVLDYIPARRVTRAWVLQRSFRTGNGWSRVALALADPGPGRVTQRLDLTARGVVRILRGVARQASGLFTHRVADRAGGACMVATGVGVILGAYGFAYTEYGRTPVAWKLIRR